MAVPAYQSLMLPLLKYAGDGEEHKIRNAIEHLAEELRLGEEERRELLPSGQQAVFNNRIGWACTYLKKAGLLDSGRKGYFSITQRGLDVLKENPAFVDVNFLTRYKEFNEFRQGRQVETVELGKDQKETDLDPGESLELSYQQLHNELVSEILSAVKKCSPVFFESIVIDGS